MCYESLHLWEVEYVIYFLLECKLQTSIHSLHYQIYKREGLCTSADLNQNCQNKYLLESSYLAPGLVSKASLIYSKLMF